MFQHNVQHGFISLLIVFLRLNGDLPIKVFKRIKHFYAVSSRMIMPLSVALTALLFTSFSLAAPMLNGVAEFQRFGKPHYYMGLYTLEPMNAKTPFNVESGFKIEFRIATEKFSIRNFRRKWREGIALNAPAEKIAQYATDFNQLMSLLNLEIQQGDRIAIVALQKQTRIMFNGMIIGALESPRLLELLLVHWLGRYPADKQGKYALLASGNIDRPLAETYEKNRPKHKRVAKKPQAHKKNIGNIDEELKGAISVVESMRKTIDDAAKAAVLPKIDLDGYFPEDATLQEKAYIIKLRSWAARRAYFPLHLFRKKEEGSVLLKVSLGASGSAHKIITISHSGTKEFENIAKRITRASHPYPPVPKAVPTNNRGQYEFLFPIEFSLHDE